MRSPSDTLRQQLQELGLCTDAQIASCRKEVDRLCDGVPQFDSVWLDVLVQRRILSRFQADRMLQAPEHGLKIGQLVLRDQLGDRSFLAITPTDQPVVIQRRPVVSQSERKALSALIATLHADRKSAPNSLAVPMRLLPLNNTDAEDSCYVAQAYQTGWTVSELIVRGGRFPWQTVLSVGHQLLVAVQWLQQRGCSHGNIAPNNVRITSDGTAVLVGALASQHGEVGISLSANLSYEQVRFVAPERIMNLHPTHFGSDLYSLASVLWNMLSGRDPFLSADPVRRITKAGQENLPDIRSLVPDCPLQLSTALQRFSKCNPQLRPANAAEAIAVLQEAGRGNQHGIKTLVRALPDRPFRQNVARRRPSASNSLSTFAVAAIMIAAFVSYGVQRGLIPSVASLASTAPTPRDNRGVVRQKFDEETLKSNRPIDHGQILTMPQPDAAGVVVLQSGRSYAHADLEFPGVMHVETNGKELATVLVSEGSTWNLAARQLSVSNIHVRDAGHHSGHSTGLMARSEGASDRTVSNMMIRAKADAVSIHRCILESNQPSRQAVCLHWAASTGTTTSLSLKDCVFKSNGSAVSTSLVPQRFEFENTLMLVKRSTVRATLPSGSTDTWPITLHRVTQPYGLTFADFLIPGSSGKPCRLVVTAGESVLAPTLALIQIASVVDDAAVESQVEFQLPERGNAVLVPPDTPTAVAWDNLLRTVVAISDGNVIADSILPASPVFRGDGYSPRGVDAGPWDGFQLIDYEGPKLTSELQGILPDELPRMSHQPD